MKNKINIGCDVDLKEGWYNLDFHGERGADLIFDLENIYKGKKIPVKNNSMEYVYCSHVLEHFFEPIPLLNEFVRMTKKGGLIEIKVPYLNEHWNSIEHRRPFTLTCLRDYAIIKNPLYNHSLEIIESCFYPAPSSGIAFKIKSIFSSFFNFLGFKLVEKTFIKYLVPSGVYIKVIYKKNE